MSMTEDVSSQTISLIMGSHTFTFPKPPDKHERQTMVEGKAKDVDKKTKGKERTRDVWVKGEVKPQSVYDPFLCHPGQGVQTMGHRNKYKESFPPRMSEEETDGRKRKRPVNKRKWGLI